MREHVIGEIVCSLSVLHATLIASDLMKHAANAMA